jgi:hypothetical protein
LIKQGGFDTITLVYPGCGNISNQDSSFSEKDFERVSAGGYIAIHLWSRATGKIVATVKNLAEHPAQYPKREMSLVAGLPSASKRR